MFTLVVDDFGVKLTNKQDAEYLVEALKDLYPITVDWIGNKYLGLILTWDYTLHHVDISMPGYVSAALLNFSTSRKRHDAPHYWIPSTYGAKI